MQIRLNASTLEEWARANRLPTKLVAVHFAPLNQLLQWLQCLSSEASIDGLIGTVQSLRALNPLQLRKAVRDYRYEVDENRMDEDCAQYLVQIQKQWERNRLQRGAAAAAATGEGAASPEGAERGEGGEAPTPLVDVVRMIDEAFADPQLYASYAPPPTEESTGELLNSRFMVRLSSPPRSRFAVSCSRAFCSSLSPSPRRLTCSSTLIRLTRSAPLPTRARRHSPPAPTAHARLAPLRASPSLPSPDRLS